MSDNSLLEHRRGDFHEAGHICSLEVVHRAVRPEAELHALLVDILHDPMQLAVRFPTWVAVRKPSISSRTMG